jgi:hypothetical protein
MDIERNMWVFFIENVKKQIFLLDSIGPVTDSVYYLIIVFFVHTF